jgi:hypothetical protein
MVTLSTKVQVSERFQRSIRIDTDMGDEAVINSFICPQSSVEVLLSMARGRKQAGEAAFTWTGPFGSGKSSLVVALNALLGKETYLRNRAIKIIGEKNAEQLLKNFNVSGRKGWTFVPVVGSRGNVAEALIAAVRHRTGTKIKLTTDILIDTLSEIAKQEECGLFIVLDEIGKILEGAAEGNSDIYLFQQLAELAARSKGKIVVLGVLHQAFAEYARRLARDVRDEWAKIQGRFVDLPLNVAGEELIDLIGRAIKSNKKPQKALEITTATAQHIATWRRVHLDSLTKSLTQCWPLHPVTAALLGPISRRRFGQNQRSVFGFLNSAEPNGFQEFLKTTSLADNILYTPSKLWDYLRANLEPSIMASPDGHKWSLAVDALFRTEAFNNNQNTLEVLKCIALMDLFQDRSGLAPERDLLSICLPNLLPQELDQILSKLSSQSIICYRKHKKAYSLYQGSDFDIDAATEEAYSHIPSLDFDRIRQAARFQPVIAKKHYHETGALRWFDVDLVPAEQALKIAKSYKPTAGSIGLVMIVLGSTESGNVDKICRTASSSSLEWPVFVTSAQNSWLIRSHAKEFQALEWIRSTNPSLGGDTVARREVESRLAKIRDSLEEHLAAALSSGKWFIDGSPVSTLTFRELYALASEKADALYPQSPKINSELINRIKPSSNSVAALKALLRAMAERQGQVRLGIEGYPAEGGLFEMLLATTGLYEETKQRRIFKMPTAKNDPARLQPLWEVADRFFKKNQNRAIPITELYSIWSSRPYGVKDGLLPFFATAYLLTRQHDYAVYHANLYRPSIDDLFVDYLTKVPGEISLRAMNFSDIGQKILAGTAETLNRIHPSLPKLSETSEPLEIARRLVMTVMDLPSWVLRTRQLSPNTIRLRELIKNANDPNKVLLDDLPSLFKEYEQNLSKGDVQPIIRELDQSLNELIVAYPNLMESLRQQLRDELQIDDKGKFASEEVNLRAKNIMHISGDFKLDAFAARLSTFKDTDSDIEGLVSLAADKPTRDWIDLDVSRAKLRIAELSQKFNHTEAYGRVHNRENSRQAIAFMVGLDGKPKTFVREFTVKQTQQKMVQEIEEKLSKILFGEIKASDDLMLAALANIGARILEKEEMHKSKRVNA